MGPRGLSLLERIAAIALQCKLLPDIAADGSIVNAQGQPAPPAWALGYLPEGAHY